MNLFWCQFFELRSKEFRHVSYIIIDINLRAYFSPLCCTWKINQHKCPLLCTYGVLERLSINKTTKQWFTGVGSNVNWIYCLLAINSKPKGSGTFACEDLKIICILFVEKKLNRDRLQINSYEWLGFQRREGNSTINMKQEPEASVNDFQKRACCIEKAGLDFTSDFLKIWYELTE